MLKPTPLTPNRPSFEIESRGPFKSPYSSFSHYFHHFEIYSNLSYLSSLTSHLLSTNSDLETVSETLLLAEYPVTYECTLLTLLSSKFELKLTFSGTSRMNRKRRLSTEENGNVPVKKLAPGQCSPAPFFEKKSKIENFVRLTKEEAASPTCHSKGF